MNGFPFPATTPPSESAFLQVSLPPAVQRQHATGSATVMLEDGTSRVPIPLQADGRIQPVPSGVYRVAVTTPFSKAVSGALNLNSSSVIRCRFAAQDFVRRRVDGVRLTGTQAALPGSSGYLWLRVVDGPGRRPTSQPYVIQVSDASELIIELDGEAPARMSLEVLSVGRARALLALTADYDRKAKTSTAIVVPQRLGRTVTLSARPANARLAQAARSAETGRLTDAVQLIQPFVDKYRSGDLQDAVEALTVAYVLVRSGDFASLSPWVESLVSNGPFLSDALVLFAEWYGHAGCHLSALNLLSQLPSSGLPLLAGCYALASARLAAYATAGTQDATGDRAASEEASQLDSNSPAGDYLASKHHPENAPHIRGQQLEDWNVSQARDVLSYLSTGISAVDWSEHFLKLDLSTKRTWLARPGTFIAEAFETRLRRGWGAVRWQLPDESKVD
jgi:hypothetical protein